MGRSDLVRRAMSKKKQSVMEKERANFIYGNEEEGVPSQEIHFQQPQLLQSRHGKLGHDGTVASPGQRHKFIRCLRADDHTCRVHSISRGKTAMMT